MLCCEKKQMLKPTSSRLSGSVLLGLLVCAAPAQRGAAGRAGYPGQEVRLVLPTMADPTLKTEFDDPNYVIFPTGKLLPELVVYLPGTHGKPKNDGVLLSAVAAGGYRTIGLMYNNVPTEDRDCGKGQDLGCAARFREERFAGDAPDAVVQNTVEESILHRLVSLLKYLDREHPKEGWGGFLAADEPVWDRIILSGHSQGAGTAAYIAKSYKVARVVLFSGPVDGIDLRSSSPKLAPWLSAPGKTPVDLWYGEFHQKELAAPLLPSCYEALHIPPGHILAFSLDLPGGGAETPVAFHLTGVHDIRYLPLWKFMFDIPEAVQK